MTAAHGTVFTRGRWAVGIAALLAFASMLRYPGGTTLDRSSVGYSLTRNFLSDLGMTIAYDGRPNKLGAVLFVLSLGVLVVGLGGSLVGFVRLYSQSRRPRRWARAAGVVGLVACLAFIGVAFTPENSLMSLHLSFTFFAWRVVTGASFLLAVASAYSPGRPRTVIAVWAMLTVMLLTYVLLLQWGPSVSTPDGLRVQAIAQKLITATIVASFFYLSLEGDRLSYHQVVPTSTVRFT